MKFHALLSDNDNDNDLFSTKHIYTKRLWQTYKTANDMKIR